MEINLTKKSDLFKKDVCVCVCIYIYIYIYIHIFRLKHVKKNIPPNK